MVRSRFLVTTALIGALTLSAGATALAERGSEHHSMKQVKLQLKTKMHATKSKMSAMHMSEGSMKTCAQVLAAFNKQKAAEHKLLIKSLKGKKGKEKRDALKAFQNARKEGMKVIMAGMKQGNCSSLSLSSMSKSSTSMTSSASSVSSVQSSMSLSSVQSSSVSSVSSSMSSASSASSVSSVMSSMSASS